MKQESSETERQPAPHPGSEPGKPRWWPRVAVRKRRRPEAAPPVWAVVDPGSTVLRVLVLAPGGAESVICGWAEEPLAHRAGRAAGEAAGVEQAFEAALTAAEAMAEQKADRVRPADQIVVGLPAWQTRGWAASVTQRRAHPTREIEERELEALLARGLRLAVNRLTDSGDRAWTLLDAVPVALGVDGQGVTDPVGFRGREMTASVFAAVAPAATIAAWRERSEKSAFGSLTLTAGPLALAACPNGPQGLVLDIGGAHTAALWWRAGRPLATSSVDVGSRLLTECLSRKWGLSSEKAETLQRAFAAGHLAAEVRGQIVEAMEPALAVWFQSVEGMLAEMQAGADQPLPHRLLICGGGSSVPAMAETARGLVLSQRLVFERYPELDRLRPEDVPGIVNRTESGQGPGDVSALALAAWAVRSMEPPGRPMRVLGRLCQ